MLWPGSCLWMTDPSWAWARRTPACAQLPAPPPPSHQTYSPSQTQTQQLIRSSLSSATTIQGIKNVDHLWILNASEMNKRQREYIPVLTDKKENKIFLRYSIRKSRRERLQSHIWLTASSYMSIFLHISSYIRKRFLIYDFATDPIWISLYMKKFYILFYQCREVGTKVRASLLRIIICMALCLYPLKCGWERAVLYTVLWWRCFAVYV
jgi:hypothetical protein